jgi:hypothetical protein
MLHSRPITAEHAGPAFRFGDSGKVPRTVSLPVAQILIRRNAVIFRHIGLACVDRDRAIASPALRPRSPVPHQFPPQLQKNVVRAPRPSNRSRTFCGILRCAHWTSTVKQVVPGSAVIMLFLENNIAPSGKQRGAGYNGARQRCTQSEHDGGRCHSPRDRPGQGRRRRPKPPRELPILPTKSAGPKPAALTALERDSRGLADRRQWPNQNVDQQHGK